MQKQLKRFKIQCWESTIYSFNNWNESYNQRRVVVWLIEVVEFEPFSKFLDTVSICRTSLDEKKIGDGHVLITFLYVRFAILSFLFSGRALFTGVESLAIEGGNVWSGSRGGQELIFLQSTIFVV